METAPFASRRKSGAAGAGILEDEDAWRAIRGYAERMRREAPDRALVEAGQAFLFHDGIADKGFDHRSMTMAKSRPMVFPSAAALLSEASFRDNE
jgi:hypothetical protein